MLKQETTKIEDSNIANYGGKDHQNAKEAKAKAELEFKGAGAAPGLEIWRIENFGVKRWPKEQYGNFYNGDCYIVLNTYEAGPQKKIHHNAHFWLGKEATQDEYGTAAFKVVELDDLLGDLPVQFREVEGYESEEFLSNFKGTIKLLSGGIDSAFNRVKPEEYKPRLLQCKGKKNTRVVDVKVDRSSLNDGDCFILDNGLEIIQWNGTSASAWEKRKGAEIVNGIKSDRPKASSRVLDGDEDDEVFWNAVGGKGEVAPATPDVEIVAVEPSLFCISDATGKMVVTKVCTGAANLKKSLLDHKDAFILDLGHKLYVWIGSQAEKSERSAAIQHATDFLKSSGRPMHTPVCRIMEGAEPTNFFEQFSG